MARLEDLPTLGAGIGYRPELREHQSKYADRIDWFELIADRYVRSVPESIERALPPVGAAPAHSSCAGNLPGHRWALGRRVL
ncbi:hypothetical protein [Stigmatella aurantiaca]|uniref:hypothetical protein n=1 Tax=Stigmatella aurantiaca TaxID=41 RepID=UPI0018DBC919|nr:hypothetical protein [Stigmatella aurantiaca]